MTLDDDQVIVQVDERVSVYVGISHGMYGDKRVRLNIYVPGAQANAHMQPKQARELAAALIAFAGEAT